MTIKEYVAQEKNRIKDYISKNGDEPCLVIVQVGDNEASNRYVRNKIKDCEEVGIHAILSRYGSDITTDELIEELKKINNSSADGIIVQLPLPKHINEQKVIDVIDIDKDVDGFKTKSKFTPCTPAGIIDYLDNINFNYSGKHAVVIGRSNIVGKPMANLLLEKDMTVTICHSKTPKELLKKSLSYADLVICATGKRGVITSQDALLAFIVDVGINFDESGKLCGDVLVEEIDRSRVTPVPGGVGLLTRLALLKNVLKAVNLKRG